MKKVGLEPTFGTEKIAFQDLGQDRFYWWKELSKKLDGEFLLTYGKGIGSSLIWLYDNPKGTGQNEVIVTIGDSFDKQGPSITKPLEKVKRVYVGVIYTEEDKAKHHIIEVKQFNQDVLSTEINNVLSLLDLKGKVMGSKEIPKVVQGINLVPTLKHTYIPSLGWNAPQDWTYILERLLIPFNFKKTGVCEQQLTMESPDYGLYTFGLELGTTVSRERVSIHTLPDSAKSLHVRYEEKYGRKEIIKIELDPNSKGIKRKNEITHKLNSFFATVFKGMFDHPQWVSFFTPVSLHPIKTGKSLSHALKHSAPKDFRSIEHPINVVYRAYEEFEELSKYLYTLTPYVYDPETDTSEKLPSWEGVNQVRLTRQNKNHTEKEVLADIYKQEDEDLNYFGTLISIVIEEILQDELFEKLPTIV